MIKATHTTKSGYKINGELGFLLFSINWKLEFYKKYLNKIDDFILEEEKKINEDWSSSLNDIEETNLENEVYYTQEIKNNFYESLLVQLISFTEKELKKIEHLCFENIKSKYKWDKLKGNGNFERIKIFLNKSCDIEVDNITSWKFINEIRKIRNEIVHGRNKKEKIKKIDVDKFIKEDLMKIDNDKFYIDNNKINKKLIEEILILFEEIILQIK